MPTKTWGKTGTATNMMAKKNDGLNREDQNAEECSWQDTAFIERIAVIGQGEAVPEVRN